MRGSLPYNGAAPSAPAPAIEARWRVLMTLDAVGGVWRYAVSLASALRPLGIQTILVGMGPPPSPEKVAEASRVGDLVWLDAPLDWTVADEAGLDQLAGVLDHLAEEHEVDLLHLNLPTQAADIHTILPVVVVSHSCVVSWWETMREGPLPESWRWQVRRNAAGLARADAVVVPSDSHAALVERCYGRLNRLKVVRNGIAPTEERAGADGSVVAAGRWWDDGKNAAVLDAAAAFTDVPVLMAGPTTGPNGESPALRHAVALGEIPHAEVLARMAAAGIVVSPSLYEPFGLAPLEGAALGAALVLADIPTYRELWDEAALFVDPRDPRALARAITQLAANPARRDEMGRKALMRSRRYTLKAQAEAMAALYRSLAATPAEIAIARI